MSDAPVTLITGTRKGIGRYLAQYYVEKGHLVIGCSREPVTYDHARYQHYCLDVCHEVKVKQMFFEIRKRYQRLDILINNAGAASMNHVLLTSTDVVKKIFDTNVIGTFIMCREAAKLMQTKSFGRIVNVASAATPLRLAGEAVYAASKAAVVSLTQMFAKEVADFSITVNAVGPSPVKTDLTRSVPKEKMDRLLNQLAIRRFAELTDVSNVIDFFIRPESSMITGQVVYLGGV